ncbi:heat shock 70 kDa protein 15-like protein [Tanacetum coccineum]
MSTLDGDKAVTQARRETKLEASFVDLLYGPLGTWSFQTQTTCSSNICDQEARKRFEKANAVYSQIRDKYLSSRKSTRTEIPSATEELHDKVFEFVTDSDREQLIAKLQETEDWLYEDGEDETKGLYVAKLDELKKLNLEFTVYGGFEISRVLHLEENVEQQKE